jgi:hypothetical protein
VIKAYGVELMGANDEFSGGVIAESAVTGD